VYKGRAGAQIEPAKERKKKEKKNPVKKTYKEDAGSAALYKIKGIFTIMCIPADWQYRIFIYNP
jgi:hypothetical protein